MQAKEVATVLPLTRHLEIQFSIESRTAQVASRRPPLTLVEV